MEERESVLGRGIERERESVGSITRKGGHENITRKGGHENITRKGGHENITRKEYT